MAGKQPAFWGAVAGVSLLTPVAANLVADRVRDIPAFAGFVTLIDYITRRNG